MAIPVIETDYIEMFITLIIFISAYFIVAKMFKIEEHQMLFTSVFALFIIFFLLALDYKLYISFTVIILFSGIVIYSYFKRSSGNNENSE